MRALGISIIALSVLVIATFGYGLFFSPYSLVFLKVAVFAIVVVVFGILGWVGYSMVKAPQPKELKDIEREIQEVVKGKKGEE